MSQPLLLNMAQKVSNWCVPNRLRSARRTLCSFWMFSQKMPRSSFSALLWQDRLLRCRPVVSIYFSRVRGPTFLWDPVWGLAAAVQVRRCQKKLHVGVAKRSSDLGKCLNLPTSCRLWPKSGQPASKDLLQCFWKRFKPRVW